jgi:hypothetical protein
VGRQIFALMVALAVMTAGCGGGSVSFTTSDTDEETTSITITPPTFEVNEETVEVVDAAAAKALDDFGEMPAAVLAILIAYDAGYSFDQIVSAIDGGTLDEQGRITGEEPAGTAFALDAGQNAVLTSHLGDLRDIDRIDKVEEALRNAHERLPRAEAHQYFVNLILLVVAAELPVDVIVEGIVLGGFTEATAAMVESHLQAVDAEEKRKERQRAISQCGLGSLIPGDSGGVVSDQRLYDECMEQYEAAATDQDDEAGGAPDETDTETPAAPEEPAPGPPSGEGTLHRSFRARLAFDDGTAFEWAGTFSVAEGELTGSGTVTGSTEGTCGIEGGDQFPVAYTAIGSFDITGTADESTMRPVLVPHGGNVNVTTGDTSQLCVELSIDAAQSMVDFPLGNEETGVLPIEIPIGGGTTSLDFGEGFIIEVTVTAN